MNTQTKHSLMLMLCAFIWGTAFVAQSAGSGMGAYSFLAGRSWLAVLVLLPTVRAFDALHRRHGAAYGWPKAPADRRHLLTAGLCCGTLLFAASAAQQIGITLNPSTAKAGFLTAMYVVLVPVFGLFLGRRGSARLWLSMVIAVGGLYLLCMKNGFGGIEASDWILLSCAVLFSFQIMTVDHFAPQVDGVRLSLLQFFVVAVESTAAALLFENPTLAEFGRTPPRLSRKHNFIQIQKGAVAFCSSSLFCFAICPKNLSKFWKINLKAFSHKSGKLCYNHNYGRGRGCAALTENNEEGGEPYGTVPLQALWCDQKRR